MKKKRSSRVISMFLAFCMVASTFLGHVTLIASAATPDGVNDTWVVPADVAGGNETKEVITEDGVQWLHVAAGEGNDNSEKPGVFLNETAGTLEEGYIEATIKPVSAADQSRFGFYVHYNGLGDTAFVGYDADGWFWQVYDGVSNTYFTGGRVAATPAGTEQIVRIEFTNDAMDVSLDGRLIFDNVDISSLPTKTGGKIGIKTAAYGEQYTDVKLKNITYTGQEGNEPAPTYTVSGKVVDAQGAGIAGASVSLNTTLTATTDAEGNYTITGVVSGSYGVTVRKTGFNPGTGSVTVSDAAATVSDITLTERAVVEGDTVISSDVMDVTIDPEFPRVIKYTMKQGADAGKYLYGQVEELNTIRINGIEITPTIATSLTDSKATYVMTVRDDMNGINAVITAELVVEANTLAFNITDIQDNNIVKTIEIRNHSLVSVNSTETDANLKAANMSNDTRVSGDRSVIVDDNMNVSSNERVGYMYAFVSNDQLSAGLWSNSENKVTSDWQRVTANATQAADGTKYMGLSSTYWTYQKDTQYRKEDGTIETEDGTVINVEELPSTKVAIAGDINGDNKINWNDGAVAYRDIMNIPYGSERVPDLVAYRIAMNFGSQAQNPFLMTLDNVKKVYLHTDGLGQSILLKGYGSEGHDSGHLNYADIGMRIGGAEDMITLLAKGAELGATFGVHVNASETYPESRYFEPDRLLKNANGNYSYGWNWIDQGINIDADYDLRNGRAQRFVDFYNALGGSSNQLDFIYVDVWGNGQSGDNGTWASRQLAKEITGLGWRLGGEWGWANEYDSTFQHWAADLTYGGYASKGINSSVARFIRNHEKDSWVGNYASYGGEAEQPLLGGMSMKDFEGWQGRSDYAAYITNMFEVNIASKFVQHFLVSTWEDGTPVNMNHGGTNYQYTPGMKATLQDEAKQHTVSIERKSNDYSDINNFRSRIIEFDGKKIFEGREGSSSYLIPWYWTSTGDPLSADEEKLYYWNSTNTASTTWELPNSWAGLTSVKVYKLTELGKTDEMTVNVVNNSITLELDKSTPYVVHKGESANVTFTWSDGMHLVDTGFNSGSLSPWTIAGDTAAAAIVMSQGSNPMLGISSNTQKTTVSQKFTDLKPNTKYAVYVGLDNRSDTRAGISVTGGKETADNSGTRSIAKNYVSAYAHSTKEAVATVNNTSYFQHMYVFFETGNDVSNVEVSLYKEAGDGTAYFDDVRIVENESQNFSTTADGRTKFYQDFENVAQGLYPFVVGGLEGVTDNRTHLAEKNAPYTQRGWNEKRINDVIDGTWSVKTNGLTKRNDIVYQTIPQNFEFEPGVAYNIEFKYEAGSHGTYAFVVGDGEHNITTSIPLTGTAYADEPGTFQYSVLGSDTGKTWIGIYSTTVDPDTQGETVNGAIDFRGYKDFMLDNLAIEEVDADHTLLRDAILAARERVQADYTEASWSLFAEKLATAEEVDSRYDATESEIYYATMDLTRATNGLVRSYPSHTADELSALLASVASYEKGAHSLAVWEVFLVNKNAAQAALDAAPQDSVAISKAYVDLQAAKETFDSESTEGVAVNDVPLGVLSATAGSQQSGEGPGNVLDNSADTIWHTSWGGGDRSLMYIQIKVNTPMSINGLRYLPRQQGSNGMINQYKVQVSTDNGATFIDAATGTWNNSTDWKEVSFAPVANTTHVRLVAVTSQTDTSNNNYASAAEIRLTTNEEVVYADGPTGLSTTPESVVGSDGTIQNVTTAMEYSNALDGTYRPCTGTTVTGLVAGDYYVRLAATSSASASLATKVTVGTDPTPIPYPDFAGQPAAPTGLTATAPSLRGEADGKISGVTTAMEYSTSRDGVYTACTGTEITGLTAGIYYVRFAATGDTVASAIARVVVAEGQSPEKPAAPTGLTPTAPTTKGGTDGKIAGVTTAMEYSTSMDGTYTACTGTEITGLAAGTYYVRFAATASAEASDAASVVVADGQESGGTIPPIVVPPVIVPDDPKDDPTDDPSGEVIFEYTKKTVKNATVKWSKTKGADGYVVYMKKGTGKFKKIATVENNITSYKKAGLAKKANYTFKVVPYKLNNKKKVEGKKISSKVTYKGKVTATWKDVTGFTSYDLYVQVTKKGEYKFVKNVVKSGTIKYSVKNASLTKYYGFKLVGKN